MNNQSNRVKAKQADYGSFLTKWVFGSVLAIAGALTADKALSQETLIESHGYNFFGELALPIDFAHLPYVNPEAPKGGEISIWAQGTFDSLNPFATQDGRPGALSSIGFERLMTGTSDEVGSSYCFLCTTIEYPEDASYMIMHLRDDVEFSDGTPMTAHDVVFTHNLFMEQGTASYRSVVSQMIPLVEALDDHTVKFTFGEDFAASDTISQAGATMVFSQTWYEANDARLDEGRLEIPPGTGPYVLDSFDQNRRIIYRRNSDYWGNDAPFNIGRNNFDTIRVEYFADTQAAFEAFKAGEFTFRRENSSLTWATGYDFPALDNGHVIREELTNGSLPGASGFVFNMTLEKFQDVRVREAMALMFNFTWTNETLQYGLFQQRESFWQGSELQAVGIPEGLELEYLQSVSDLIDPALLTEDVRLPHMSSERQLDRGNLRLASALLDDAGWIAGDDGIRRKDGQALTVEFLGTSPSFDRILLPYVDNLTRLGIEATYNRIDPAQFTQRTNVFDFDMIFDSYRVGLEEGEGLGQRFGSDGVGDIFNPASYTNPAVDELIKLAVAAETYDEMAAAVRAIDRVMRDDLFIVPVWFLGKHWTAYYDMFRHPENMPPYDLGYLDFWWYDADAAAQLREAGAIR